MQAVFPWRQGTPCGDVIASVKFSQPERLLLMFDETGFVKKGKDSVGVARQYCGTRGKVENCQVGVFAGYASRQGYTLVDKRLFLPELWFTDVYAARRTKCKVPAELTFQRSGCKFCQFP
jgi:SRSO17 transposase